jgi:hypothetical protein
MGHWKTINGKKVYIKSRGENRSSQVFHEDCKTKNFKSKEAYRKNEAYQHIHNINPKHPPYSKITIRGKPHKVIHGE